MATFTKNKRTGNYDVIGTPDEIQGGCSCEVTKKDGTTKTVIIEKVGKPFVAKFGPNKGSKCVIGTVASRKNNNYVPAKRDSRGYVTERGHYVGYCGYPCPVTGMKCCPKNGPCHDCE